jgi:hypothetical protein
LSFGCKRGNYPSGLLEIDIDKGRERLVCKYFFASGKGEETSYNNEYKINVSGDNLSLSYADRWESIPRGKIAEEILGSFFPRI